MIIKRLIKYTIWTIGFVIMCFVIFTVLRPKYYFSNSDFKSPETEIWKDFYELSEDMLDMIFVGSSHVYSGINAMEFYEKTGCKTYNMSSSSQDMMVSYYYLKEMFSKQSPNYVIVDTYGMLYETECDYTITVRAFQDMDTFSQTRLEAINDYVERHMGNEIKYKIHMMFPYINAHSRWDELTNIDFNPNEYDTSEMGFVMYTDHSERVVNTEYYDNNECGEISEYVVEYFEKILSLCESNNAKVIMVTIPYEGFSEGNAIALQRFADKYGVDYYNYGSPLECEAAGLSDLTDWKNINHLNWRGAKKITDYIIDDFIEKDILTVQEQDVRMKEIHERYLPKAITCELESSYNLSEYFDTLDLYSDYINVDAYQMDDCDNTVNLINIANEKGYSIKEVQNNKIVVDYYDYYLEGKGIEFIVWDSKTNEVIDAIRFDSDIHYKR